MKKPMTNNNFFCQVDSFFLFEIQPKIRMYSKYERRTDTRTYEDRKKLYEGGWEVVRAEHLQALWKEKYDEWLKRPKGKYLALFG